MWRRKWGWSEIMFNKSRFVINQRFNLILAQLKDCELGILTQEQRSEIMKDRETLLSIDRDLDKLDKELAKSSKHLEGAE